MATAIADWPNEVLPAFVELLSKLVNPATLVANILAALSLFVAYKAFRTATRSASIAEKTYLEKGRLKDCQFRLSPRQFRARGTISFLRSARPDSDEGRTQSAVFSAYSGSDSVEIEDVLLLLTFRKGAPFAKALFLTVSFANHPKNLPLSGPTLPAKIGPYQRLDWRLPSVTIAGPVQGVVPKLPPGVLFLTAYEHVSVQLIVTTTNHQAIRRRVDYGYRLGLVTRRYTFFSVTSFISDDEPGVVPDNFKNFIRRWQGDAKEDTTEAEKLQPSSAPRRNRGRKRRR